MSELNYNPLNMNEYAEHCMKEIEDLEEDDNKEDGIGVREPRRPIKPSDKDSIALDIT